MKKILYLCHRIPYPPNKGDKIRSFNEIRFLSKNNIVDLITLADDTKDMKYSVELEKYCRYVKVFPINRKLAAFKGMLSIISGQSISQGYFYKKEFQKVFDQLTASQKYDTLICFSSPMAEYVFKAVKKKKDIADTLIMDFCDLDSDKWNQYSEKKIFPLSILYKIEGFRLLRFEKKINRNFHRSIFVSRKEGELFKEYYPDAGNIDIIPNGVDHDYFKPEEDRIDSDDTKPIISFFGAMDYYANVDGALWFAEKIWPLIKKEIPNTEFYIVGSNPDPRLKALIKDPGIKITGFVEDIRKYYAHSTVCVIPLRIARGVQNKVLEAMSMGKPVVSTSQAVQGINVNSEVEILVENNEMEFAEKVINLIKNPSKARCFGNSARSFVVKNHDWETCLQDINV